MDRQWVLHVGGSASDALIVREALAASKSHPYDIEWVETLANGLERLIANRTSAVLLDLRLPDSPGLRGLEELLQAAPATPILVVGADEDEEVGARVVGAGAHDYLLTTHLDGYWLPRALRDAIERKLSEQAFLAERQRLEATLDSAGDALLSTDASGRVTYLNKTAEMMTGWPQSDAEGRPVEDVLKILDGAPPGSSEDSLELALPEDQTPNPASDAVLMRRDGSEVTVQHSAAPIYDRLGLMTGTAIVFRDVSSARASSLQVTHLASHDPLTDLPNRLLLSDRLARALSLARRHQRLLAVLFIDIDHFKFVNDSLGHMVGDALLRDVARELTTCVRSSDTVSRHGGDEFVVVLSELERVEDAAVGAKKIIATLSRPRKLAGHELYITVSIGVSVYPAAGEDAETLLTNADTALYDAKNHGRDCYRLFKSELNERVIERQSIEACLQSGLDNGEFELFYQPKINLKTDAIVGAEALIRWQHPDRGLMEAAQFISIAEDCGLIRPIGRWAVQRACQEARTWQIRGLRPIPVSVNISAGEFQTTGFLNTVVDILKETRLEPRYLEIELTESVLMAHLETAKSVLHPLKNLGVQLTIDDFGTGWSSLSYLSHFPIDALKVDKSFVQEITADSQPPPVVSAAIRLGKSLQRRVIAAGVETAGQLAFLKSEDCGEGQGYYFSRPLNSPQFTRLLETYR